MNKTVLRLVQDVLSAMNSDEINSIGDTIESEQVTRICREEFDILSELKDWGHRQALITLTPSNSVAQPTRMQLPTNVSYIDWIKYDKQTASDTEAKFQDIKYRSPEEWLTMVLGRTTGTNIVEITDNVQSLKYRVYNDRGPSWWTSFDDEYIWFDGYDAAVDNTLKSIKTLVSAKVRPSFTEQDTHVIDIPDKDFYLYKSIVLSRAYAEIKEAPHPTAAATARSLLIKSQINKGKRQNGAPNGVDYGR